MRTGRTTAAHAARVAAVATLIVMALYVVGVIVLNVVVADRLTHEVDGRLASHLAHVTQADLHPGTSGDHATRAGERNGDIDDAPTFLWTVSPSGSVTALNASPPSLPRRNWSGAPVTLRVGTTSFRFRAEPFGAGWLVSGQSVAEIGRAENATRGPEIVIGLVLLVVVFVGSLIIGLRAAAPLEVVRRRQAEFTADASHELRTPLSVIEAEVELALSRPRDAGAYEAVLGRIAAEGRRLRRIVDDLLWLARTDGGKGADGSMGVVDVGAIAASCTERFQSLSERRSIALSFHRHGRGPFTVLARPDDIDRLAGVLVDNACKHAGEDGHVEVGVRVSGSRVAIEVDDSGAGIPEDQVPLIFDRFHRATDSSGGTGLGLAIADAVVRATRGSWTVRRSHLGGAHMEVSWRRASRHPSSPAPSATTAPAAESPATPSVAAPRARGRASRLEARREAGRPRARDDQTGCQGVSDVLERPFRSELLAPS